MGQLLGVCILPQTLPVCLSLLPEHDEMGGFDPPPSLALGPEQGGQLTTD